MKGLDSRGYIRNDIALANIQTHFQQAFQEIVTTYWQRFGNLTHSLYLYGSVGRGTAVAGTSDLDISVVLHQPLTHSDRDKILQLEQDLARQYPVFSMVEFDIGHYDEVVIENQFEWSLS